MFLLHFCSLAMAPVSIECILRPLYRKFPIPIQLDNYHALALYAALVGRLGRKMSPADASNTVSRPAIGRARQLILHVKRGQKGSACDICSSPRHSFPSFNG